MTTEARHADAFARFALDGRRALVTGAGRGIGRAIATGLAAAGALVAFHDLADDGALAAAAAAAGGLAIHADLAAPDAAVHLAAEAAERLGGVDILVLNASVQARERWAEVSDAAAAHQLAVNLETGRRLLQALVPAMAERGWGRVLAIGSIQERREHPDMLVYAATKAAQTSMIRNLARQLAASGVTLNNLAPGVVLTERNAEALADPVYRAKVMAQIPAGHAAEAQDCVGPALLLCSEAGRYITGTTLFVDGGMHL
ncbi:SDR family NAD(P)-dependent oxidoreductase [Acuticoccus kandeliae]|uniref:SDR family NAD(P)-dependent oxidoreductase n=1 Tax=Acuticoccus kandeliae TaxID=2073160 RepID=UPI000D3E622C|nr:SDR family oxidoreductase [Acuticoccus kandeliae]